jgi:phosphatidylinositol alpha-1,6-mannosyltransferase
LRKTRRSSDGILLVSELFPPAVGGSAEVFGNIYSRLRSAKASVLTAKLSEDRQRPAGLFEHVWERPMRSGEWGVLHPAGLFNHVQVARNIRNITRSGVGFVHCGRVLPEGLSALMAFSAGAPPYVCWVHGEELGYVDSSRELQFLARRVFRHARAVVANSGNTAELLKQRGVPESAIHVVRPGVDYDRFRPDVPGAARLRRELAPGGETICLTVGRLQRRKGHDLVIEALAGMRDVSRIRYVIVGDGEERPRLEALIRTHRLEPNVVFAGRVKADDLPMYYAAADLFVHPNRVDGSDFEGFGVVFLEAAACGLPVIAGRSGGVPEAVADGVSGVLVSGSDALELRTAMQDLIDAPAPRQAMGQRARARVLAEFGWQRAADQIADVHERMSCH